MSLHRNKMDTEADLICEALVKEIKRAPRWCAIVDAWEALVIVRRMQKDFAAERAHLTGCSTVTQGMAGSPRVVPPHR